MAQNWRFLACWASFFAEELLEGPCWASYFAQLALRPGLVGDVAHEAGGGGGFALHEALWRCVVGVSEPHVVQIPPIGGGEAPA